MTNSADPDQLASSEANWSGSALFAKTGHVVFGKRRVKRVGFKLDEYGKYIWFTIDSCEANDFSWES